MQMACRKCKPATNKHNLDVAFEKKTIVLVITQSYPIQSISTSIDFAYN